MTNTVKYIIRAVKYFFYFTFLMIIIMCVLVLAHVVGGKYRDHVPGRLQITMANSRDVRLRGSHLSYLRICKENGIDPGRAVREPRRDNQIHGRPRLQTRNRARRQDDIP